MGPRAHRGEQDQSRGDSRDRPGFPVAQDQGLRAGGLTLDRDLCPLPPFPPCRGAFPKGLGSAWTLLRRPRHRPTEVMDTLKEDTFGLTYQFSSVTFSPTPAGQLKDQSESQDGPTAGGNGLVERAWGPARPRQIKEKARALTADPEDMGPWPGNRYRGGVASGIGWGRRVCAALILVASFIAPHWSLAADAVGATSSTPWWLWPLVLFFFCFVLGIIAVLAGVGGGVL